MKAVVPRSWRHPLLVFSLTIVGLGLLVAGGVLLTVALTPVPDIASFADRQVAQSTKIYDRTGQKLLYDYNRDTKRESVSLANVSPHAINATLAIEDSSFYAHGGIRITSIIRAAIADIIPGGATQGGSTITQQVVKNTLLTSRKTISRKVHEWVLAIRLEEAYSKNQILETYLNTVPYGGVLYGIGTASQAYFGIPARDLTLAQSAYLAAMLRAPSYYSPYGSHREQLDARKNLVLSRMHELGFITTDEYENAKSEQISFAPTGAHGIVAPHFVFYILHYLEEAYGTNALMSGLRVTTTLDADLQIRAEEAVKKYALKNASSGGAKNGALVAIDPSTGQILSMVGSRDFFDTTIDGQYNTALALRQPGSTMKPFIYSLALDRGYTPSTTVFDVPTQFSTACAPAAIRNNTYPCYAPHNYDSTFRGTMTFRTALAQSINIPAVKVLYLVGIRSAVERAEAMGLTTLRDPSRYGLALVLGGGEVRLLDLVGAYGVFANDGIKNTPVGILEIKDASGAVLEEYASAPVQAISVNTARTISSMLSDEYARIPAYAPGGVLSIPGYEVAAKTGTTDNSRDAWTIGYTPSIAVGVWVGNNDNTPAASLAGLIAAPMWKEVMIYATSKYPKKYFGEPDPIIDQRFTTESLPPTDPQFPYWEYGIRAYYGDSVIVSTPTETAVGTTTTP